MSTELWPAALKPLIDGFTREAAWEDPVIQKAADGKSFRLSTQVGAKYRYSFRVVCDVSQDATIVNFYNARQGEVDSFFFTDTRKDGSGTLIDPVQRQVRFEGGLVGRRLSTKLTEYAVSLVTVL